MSALRYEALLIDFYGTICAGDRAAVAAACRNIVETLRLSLTPDELAIRWGKSFFAVVERSNHDAFQLLYDCECISLRETLAELVGEVDPEPFVADLEAYWRSPWLHTDAREALAAVHLPIGCVSNADTAPLMTAIERLGLSFDAVISSEATRCYKPEPEIFRQALEALGVTAERALHVGDSLHSDISGAAGAGITTVWLRRSDRIHDIGRCAPDHTITTLAELPELLG